MFAMVMSTVHVCFFQYWLEGDAVVACCNFANACSPSARHAPRATLCADVDGLLRIASLVAMVLAFALR